MTTAFHRLLAAAALVAAVAATLPAHAAGEGDRPVQTTATYGDWTVRCRALAAGTDQLCEMLQVVKAKGGQGALANIAVGRMPEDKTMRVVVQLPIAVHLPDAVQLKVGGKTLVTPQFESCFQTFCLARADLGPEATEAFRKAGAMSIVFKDRARAEKAVPVSLMGFTAAYRNTFESDKSGS